MTSVRWLAIALAALSGVIHLLLAAIVPVLPLRGSFLLVGLEFSGGIALVLVDYRRPLLYALRIPFTAIQIALW